VDYKDRKKVTDEERKRNNEKVLRSMGKRPINNKTKKGVLKDEYSNNQEEEKQLDKGPDRTVVSVDFTKKTIKQEKE